MANSYYEHSERPVKTMRVRDIMAELEKCDPDDRVIFRSPFHGAYGPGAAYSVDKIEKVFIPGYEHVTPAGEREDEETGEKCQVEEYVQIFHAWQGVVIS